MSDSDYNKYIIDELYAVLKRIDKKAYPEYYQLILQEIKSRNGKTLPSQEKYNKMEINNKESNSSHVTPAKTTKSSTHKAENYKWWPLSNLLNHIYFLFKRLLLKTPSL